MINAIQQSSKLAKAGALREAQALAKCWGRKMKANITTSAQVKTFKEFDSAISGTYNMIKAESEKQKSIGKFDYSISTSMKNQSSVQNRIIAVTETRCR